MPIYLLIRCFPEYFDTTYKSTKLMWLLIFTVNKNKYKKLSFTNKNHRFVVSKFVKMGYCEVLRPYLQKSMAYL